MTERWLEKSEEHLDIGCSLEYLLDIYLILLLGFEVMYKTMLANNELTHVLRCLHIIRLIAFGFYR